MADPANDYQLPPQQESVVALKAYRDIRAEISEMDKKGIELQKISAKFSRDDQATLKEKRAEIEYTTKNIQKQMKEQAEMITKRGHISDDIERNAFEKLVKSHNQKMAFEKETLDGLKQEADLFVKMRADQIEAQGKSAKYFGSALKFGFDNLGIQSKELTNVQNIHGKLKEFPKLGGALGKSLSIVVTLLISAFDLFKKFDKAAWDFRKAMGVTRPDVKDLRDSIQASAISMMNLGVTVDDLYNVTKALGSEMGGIRNVSADLRDNMALVKAQLGVSEETSAKFLRNMAAIAGKSMISQKNAVYIAGSLSAAAGTNLNQVMGDVANASSVTLSLMGRMPNQMLRTAIEARRFNTSINDVARANRNVLDFTTSIQDEMEASVLLGHSINLQKLRQLSFEGDMEAAMKERIRIAEKEDFLNIKNVFQKDALAKALGTSVEDLTKQLQVNKEIDRMRNSADPKEREALKRYEDKLALSEKDMNIEGEKFRLGLMNEGNQERTANIANSFNQIMAQLGKVFLPLIDVSLKFIADHMGWIVGGATTLWVLSGGIGRTFRSIGQIVSRLGFKALLAPLWVIWNVVRRILTPIIFAYNIYKEIKNILSDKKLMNTKGFWAFNGALIARAVGGIVRALWKALNFFFMGLPGLVLDGIKGIGGMLSEAIQSPFKKAWAWLKTTFLGESPSTLGMMIVDGIRSIIPMIFDALTSPFKAGWSWIKKNVPGVEWAAKKMGGAAGDNTLQKPIEQRMVGSYIPAATITPEKTELATSPNSTGLKTEEKPADTTTLADVLKSNNALLDAINGLRKDLNDGKVAVYMDSALVSTMMAKNIEFRGSFGVNR